MLIENALGGKTKEKTQDPQYQNLFNVRQLLNLLGGNPEAVDTLFSQYATDALCTEVVQKTCRVPKRWRIQS